MSEVAEAVREASAVKANNGGKNVMKLLNENQAAEMLGCTVSALRKWRLLGNGPAYIKVGRLVRYAEADLSAYLDAHRVRPTNGEGRDEK